MTHTLHRAGDINDLKGDFVILSMSAKNLNSKGSSEKLKSIFKILEKYDCCNYGDAKTGSILNVDSKTILDKIKDNSVITFVLDDKEKVIKAMNELSEKDLGLSIVVEGLIDEVSDACKKTNLKMHSVACSGGIYGKLDLLPEEAVVKVTTMCGHGLVSAKLVIEELKKVKSGKKSLSAAARELAKPCICGIFNLKRAELLLEKMLEED